MTRPAAAHNELQERIDSQPRSSFIAIGKPEAALAFGMFVAFVFLILRNTGLYPSIFSDEYSYSQASRLMKAATSNTPLYIYYYIYRLTRHAGTEFLEAARFLNAIFFVGAAPFIYQAARRVTSKWIAVMVAMLSLIDPINTYTAYFMPEGMYFFVFWWMSWFLLCRRHVPAIYYAAATGLLLTVLMLVKVNAIFLLPGIMAFMVYANYRDGSPSRLRLSATQLIAFLLTVAVARLTLGYLFAGRVGLHVLGSRYGTLADSSVAPARLSLLTSEIFGVLRGHVLGLALLFAVPLASLFAIVFRKYGSTEEDKTLSDLAAYTLVLLASLVVVVGYFTASVVDESPYESLSRLHMRYYNFLFPLFLMVVAGQLTVRDMRRNRYVVLLSVAILGALILISFPLLLRGYTPSLVDSPELHGVTMTTTCFYIIGSLGVVSLVVWALSQRRGAQLALFIVMPAMILVASLNGNTELRRDHAAASVEDKAGVFARDELDPLERSRVVVVGSEPAGLFHMLFHIDDAKAVSVVLPPGAPFDPKAIPPNHDWVLMMGDHALPEGIDDKIVRDGYVLFHLPSSSEDARPGFVRRSVSFSHPFRFGLIESLHGTSVPELFGRWSDGNQVQIEMSAPLPHRFELSLMARAFGPNTQLPFVIRIGGEQQTFRLSSDITVVTLPFTTDGKVRNISIEIPQPTSPRQLGLGNDDRSRGIALMQMSIEAPVGSGAAQ